jgi:hypothetical protein
VFVEVKDDHRKHGDRPQTIDLRAVSGSERPLIHRITPGKKILEAVPPDL